MAADATTTYSIGKFTKPTISKAETMMRGIIDYTNPALFNLFESGYSFLTVLARPAWLEAFPSDSAVGKMLDLFCWILEYEFRGLDGIEDVQAEALEFTDGINTINTIGKVTKQSASEVSMTFTERSGLALTKFIEFYLTGIKDPRTQARTYHGLIKAGTISAGFENEVFQLLYIVTDNTLLGLEKAYLLANAWPSKAETSMLSSEKGSIEKKEISIPWQCFVLDGEEVNELAVMALACINESDAVKNYYDKLGETATANKAGNAGATGIERARLDSTDYVEGSNMYSAVSKGKELYDNDDSTKGWGA